MSRDPIATHLEGSLAALQRATHDAALLDVARNIAAAIAAALRSGNKLLIVGNGGSALRPLCDHLLIAPSDDTPVIQQIHLAVAHGCDEIEQTMMRETLKK